MRSYSTYNRVIMKKIQTVVIIEWVLITERREYLQSTSQPKMSSKKGSHVGSWVKKCIRSIPTQVYDPLNDHWRAVG